MFIKFFIFFNFSNISGEIFVPTSLHFPYNFSEKEMLMLGFFDENTEI